MAKNFRQTRNYFFRDKFAVFARNCKFANLTQYNFWVLGTESAISESGGKASAESKCGIFLTHKFLFIIKLSLKAVCTFATEICVLDMDTVINFIIYSNLINSCHTNHKIWTLISQCMQSVAAFVLEGFKIN